LQLERRYIALFGLDKSVDDGRWKLMCEDISKADYWKDHSEYLMMWTLAIAPEYQRKGIGGLLTDACLQEAKEKKIGVGLLASPQGKGLYLRKGFKEIARATWGNPELNGTAMIWTYEDFLA
jgi:ribosomal protein S18 acetylase RimI-like enzyme